MVGRRVSHYQILEKLGEGGMGAVYRARDTRLNRLVALKFLHSRALAAPEQVARFEQEARAIAALSHPHIATIHELGEADGERFLVLEFLPGGTLKARILELQAAGRKLPFPEAIRYAVQLAQALAHAHQRGITHRDVKSDNAMFTAEGVLKLTDFGLAKLTGAADLTETGVTVGTAAYMSPEQAQGLGADHRSDIFAFGIVLYEMIAGQLPFRGEHGLAVLYQIVNQPAPPLLLSRPDVPADLEALVLRCLEKKPEHRFQFMEAAAAHLQAIGREIEQCGCSPSRQAGPLPAAVAVLPFANLSPDPENEYFSDGLTEDLISALSQMEGLRVVARTSAFQFKGKAHDIREVGRQLNVGAVLEGSVRRAGDRIRVTAQLVNVADGFQLWSERYDRQMRDVFAIQDEICAAIVKALRVKFAGEGRGPIKTCCTESLDAYHHLLKGRYYWNKWTEEGFRRGMEHYGQAIASDPCYAPAYAGLADCLAMLGFWGLAQPSQVMPQAKALALKAAGIDDALAQAHASLGTVLALYEWDWEGAARELGRAVELNPGWSGAHLLMGIAFQAPFGRWEQAIRSIRTAVELDPLSLINNTYLGTVYWMSGRTEEAIEQYRRTLELDPNFAEAWRCLGWAYLTPPRLEDALPAFQKAVSVAATPFNLADLARAYALAGRADEARRLMVQLQELSRTSYVSPYCFAEICFGLNEREEGFRWLERAYEERSSWLMWIQFGPMFAPLRSDPRLQAIARKVFPSG